MLIELSVKCLKVLQEEETNFRAKLHFGESSRLCLRLIFVYCTKPSKNRKKYWNAG